MSFSPNAPTIIRRKQVQARTGLGRSTIYERVKAGTFPAPISLGSKAVGWVESEIEDFINARIADRNNKHLSRELTS